MKNKLKFLSIVLVLMFSTAMSLSGESVASSQEIIPADRRIDWSYAGIPGGIPHRTIICESVNSALYGNGTTDATAAIQLALENCPDGQVVYLPAGVYKVSDTIHLDDFDTLRGAGPGITILKHSGGYLRSMVDMRGMIYWQIAGLHKTYDVVQAKQGCSSDHPVNHSWDFSWGYPAA
jgi:hypothetical protein